MTRVTTVAGLARLLHAALPVATRAMNAEKSSGGEIEGANLGAKAPSPPRRRRAGARAVTRAACRATRSWGLESSA